MLRRYSVQELRTKEELSDELCKYCDYTASPNTTCGGCNCDVAYNDYVDEQKYKEEERKMQDIINKKIMKMFPKTEDSVLVQKWFGEEFKKPLAIIMLAGKETEILKEAEKLEKEETKTEETKKEDF